MTKTSMFRFGIALQCLAVVAIIVHFASEYKRESELSRLEPAIASLSERIDSVANRIKTSGNDGVSPSLGILSEVKSIRHELADTSSMLKRPAHLSRISFWFWFLLTVSGIFLVRTGMK